MQKGMIYMSAQQNISCSICFCEQTKKNKKKYKHETISLIVNSIKSCHAPVRFQYSSIGCPDDIIMYRL